MATTAAPYQGAGWTDRLLNRGFAFVHIWSHFVQLAAFVAPPFYLLAKVLDLPIIPTGTAFGMGLNAGAACYCGAMEVLGATRDAGDDVSARDWTSQRLLALRAFEARAWRRRQARIGALDDDAYERGRAFQAYEELLAELA